MENRADFFAVFKIEGFFGSVRFKLDNSIVKTGLVMLQYNIYNLLTFTGEYFDGRSKK